MDKLYLRPLKKAEYLSLHSSIKEEQELCITTLNDMTLTPLGQISPSLKKNGERWLVDDNDFCTLASPSVTVDIANHLKGRTLYGGWLRKIWGHFLMGGLARLWPVLNPQIVTDIDHILFFAHDTEMLSPRGNYLEIFRLLGINNKIVIVGNSSTVSTEELLVPDISFECDRFHSIRCRETFEFIARQRYRYSYQRTNSEIRKVFLTRSQLNGAETNEVNINLLDRFFQANGYEVIAPEKLSLPSLIKLLHSASEIASISGSTAHNIVFMTLNPHCRFTVIERHAWVNTFQVNINKMLGINSVIVDAFYMPLFSTSQGFVFLYGFTEEFQKMCHDYKLDGSVWEKRLNSTCYKRRELRQYMRRYRRYYGNSQALEPWEIASGNILAEAVYDTNLHYQQWLIQLRPLTWYDYLTPRFYLRWLKSILRRR